jgi:hypothetical protein
MQYNQQLYAIYSSYNDVPQELTPETPWVHFSRFSLVLKRLRLAKVSSRSVMRPLLCQVFTTMSST